MQEQRCGAKMGKQGLRRLGNSVAEAVELWLWGADALELWLWSSSYGHVTVKLWLWSCGVAMELCGCVAVWLWSCTS